MRILVAATLFTHAKDYVLDAFLEMQAACFQIPAATIDTIVYGDRPLGTLNHRPLALPGPYSEDMLMVSRDQGRLDAIAGEYDLLMWCGVDALWQSAADFGRVAHFAHTLGAVVAPLISARTDALYPVCRRFIEEEDGSGPSERQEEIDPLELGSGELIHAGFPQADATFIPRSMYEIAWADHTPWYTRVANDQPNLCAEEWWCLKAARAGNIVLCDTATKVWHADHDGTARMYPGINVPLATLHWP